MRYQGGKFFISSDISKIINESISGSGEGVTFVSLFCGACSVESKVKGFDKIICNDNNEYLIALLKGVQNGYELPDSISEEEYKYVREHKDEDKALTGFVGFGCSFGGRFFAGYARDRRKKRDFAFTAKRGLMRDMAVLAEIIVMFLFRTDVSYTPTRRMPERHNINRNSALRIFGNICVKSAGSIRFLYQSKLRLMILYAYGRSRCGDVWITIKTTIFS